MNERIKELAVQSDLWRMLDEYSWEFGNCDPEKDCGRIEKFAELILKDCIEQFNGYTTVDYAIIKVKEHYGIE